MLEALSLTHGERDLPSIPASQSGKRSRGRKRCDAYDLEEHLKEHESVVLLLARDSNVPFTNNRTERDLRMSELKQDISGCVRKAALPQACCRIASYL
jgi:hypothetical protein